MRRKSLKKYMKMLQSQVKEKLLWAMFGMMSVWQSNSGSVLVIYSLSSENYFQAPFFVSMFAYLVLIFSEFFVYFRN